MNTYFGKINRVYSIGNRVKYNVRFQITFNRIKKFKFCLYRDWLVLVMFKTSLGWIWDFVTFRRSPCTFVLLHKTYSCRRRVSHVSYFIHFSFLNISFGSNSSMYVCLLTYSARLIDIINISLVSQPNSYISFKLRAYAIFYLWAWNLTKLRSWCEIIISVESLLLLFSDHKSWELTSASSFLDKHISFLFAVSNFNWYSGI